MDEDTRSTGTDAPAVVDTADTQATEADVQVSDGAPEAPQQKEENAEVKATDTAEEKLYAGKYKSVEDMEKAYQELNSKFTNTAQEKAELSRILNEAFVTPEPTAQATATEAGYDDEPSPVNQEIEALKATTAVQGFVMNHQDADGAAIMEVIKTDPLVKQISGHEAKLEYAYLRSQNMSQQRAIAEAQKTGAQAAQAKIAEKQVAQVETAQKAEPVDDGSELYDRATGNHPREVRDKARLDIIRKNLVNL